MSNNLIEINETSFGSTVNKGYALVDFWAPWCRPCLQLMPSIEKLSDEMIGDLYFFKVNIDDNRMLSSKMNIMSVPTLILFKDGVEVSRKIGSMSYNALKMWVDENTK